jgi:hypothetical protein
MSPSILVNGEVEPNEAKEISTWGDGLKEEFEQLQVGEASRYGDGDGDQDGSAKQSSTIKKKEKKKAEKKENKKAITQSTVRNPKPCVKSNEMLVNPCPSCIVD